jgi:threonine dehydrogenase-like Zn-dependent dehydrogenase
MAEPLSCTTNAVLRTKVQAGDTVALVGTGFMGLILLQQIRQSAPKKIIAIDLREDMLNLAKILGADLTINPLKEDPENRLQGYLDGKKADVVFEVGGTEKTLNLAAGLCRMEGKLVLFGYHPGPRTISDLGFWNWMAFDIINAHFRDLDTILNGTKVGMDMLNKGQINMSPLITHTFPLKEINQAFASAKEKAESFVKAVIVFDN